MGETFEIVKQWLKAMEARDVERFTELTSEEINAYDEITVESKSNNRQLFQIILGKVPAVEFFKAPRNMTKRESHTYRNIEIAPPLRIEFNSHLECGNEIWMDYFLFIKADNLYYGVSPASNEIKVRTISKFVVENGKITKSEAIFDNLAMLQQIGILMSIENDQEKIKVYLQKLRDLKIIE